MRSPGQGSTEPRRTPAGSRSSSELETWRSAAPLAWRGFAEGLLKPSTCGRLTHARPAASCLELGARGPKPAHHPRGLLRRSPGPGSPDSRRVESIAVGLLAGCRPPPHTGHTRSARAPPPKPAMSKRSCRHRMPLPRWQRQHPDQGSLATIGVPATSLLNPPTRGALARGCCVATYPKPFAQVQIARARHRIAVGVEARRWNDHPQVALPSSAGRRRTPPKKPQTRAPGQHPRLRPGA